MKNIQEKFEGIQSINAEYEDGTKYLVIRIMVDAACIGEIDTEYLLEENEDYESIEDYIEYNGVKYDSASVCGDDNGEYEFYLNGELISCEE